MFYETSPSMRARASLHKYKHFKQQRLLQHRAQRFTPRLLQIYGIAPHGNALLTWITDEPCRNHQEAMEIWIRQQLSDAELQQMPDKRLGHVLADRFQVVLHTIEDALP